MPKFIFVSGSSGTGKSTLAKELEELVANRWNMSVSILSTDHYYLPKSQIDPNKKKNFDVPEAFDLELIEKHIKALESGKDINRPTYDMPSSDRIPNGEVLFKVRDVIIVEGIFAADYMDYLDKNTDKLKVYILSPHVNQNYTRKESRDLVERKKTPDHIRDMRKNQIGCLFQFLAKHMNNADMVIDNNWKPTEDWTPDSPRSLMLKESHCKKMEAFLTNPENQNTFRYI